MTTDTTSIQPKKYGVGQAIGDVTKSIKYNFLAYSVTTLAMVAVLIGLIWIADSLLYSSVAIFGLLFILLFVPFFFHVYQSFTVATMAVLIKASQEGKKLKALQPLKESLPAMRRIALANLISNLVAFGPIILALLIVLLSLRGDAGAGLIMLVPILIFVGIIWFIVAGVRYSLSAVVAQYEPQVPVKQTLTRSKELLGSGGQWMVVLGAILASIIASLISNPEPESTFLIFIQLALILVVLSYAFGGLAAIYFNRTARTNQR